MAQVLEREPAVLEDDQRPEAANAARILAEYLKAHAAQSASLTLREGAKDGKTITVPPEAFRMFVKLMVEMARGRPVTIVPYNAELTTQEAAEVLNVSRPYVVRLLEEGHIPFRKVGPRRRIRFADLMQFKLKDDAQRRDVAADLTREAEGMGLYEG